MMFIVLQYHTPTTPSIALCSLQVCVECSMDLFRIFCPFVFLSFLTERTSFILFFFDNFGGTSNSFFSPGQP